MVTARRRGQAVTAPIFDDILAIAIFRRKTVASVKCMLGAGAALVAVIAAIGAIVMVVIAMIVATIVMMIVTMIVMGIAMPVIVMIVGKDGASC